MALAVVLSAALISVEAQGQAVPSTAPSPRAPSPRVTFSKDLAPVLFEHCAPCHRPGGSAGFSLLTFAEARPRARQLAAVTSSRAMPPWQPEPGYGNFVGERRLSDQQIALFGQWVDSGMPEGARSDLPRVPEWPADWQLGSPDLVLTMPAYTLRAAGPDMFRNFVIRVPTDTLRYVRAWEFRPGNPRVVHHATLQIDPGGASRRFDEQDAEAGYEGLIAPSARAPDGFFLDWAPGHRPQVAPDGIAWPLPASSDLLMMLHLRPDGREETVQASVALYFSDTPPARTPVMLRLTRQDFDIPAGERQFAISDSYTLPIDLDVFTVQPHAHYLAREMRGFARLPDGTIRWLVYIKRWDFDWQDVYRYSTPIVLPAGTTLVMEYTYDNSTGNRRNPHVPPKRITYGQQTSDEMAEMWFQVVPRSARDRASLTASLTAKVLREEIKGRRAMLAKDPANVALRDDLAVMLADIGDAGAAAQEFAETLRLKPESAAARYNVGAALLRLGRPNEARSYFEHTLRADPTHLLAHYNLALVLQSAGDLPGAIRHFLSALDLAPDEGEIQLAAGAALARAGRRRDGEVHLRRALQARPDWPDALTALAWILAVAPDADTAQRIEAVRLAERAVALSQRPDPGRLDILATALAAAGEFDRAIATEEEALRSAAGEAESTRTALRHRLDVFRQRQRYEEPTPAPPPARR
jgi:tetratricopeptide (TPR) repeat protein/mono/diheme cytochrome c family protein